MGAAAAAAGRPGSAAPAQQPGAPGARRSVDGGCGRRSSAAFRGCCRGSWAGRQRPATRSAFALEPSAPAARQAVRALAGLQQARWCCLLAHVTRLYCPTDTCTCSSILTSRTFGTGRPCGGRCTWEGCSGATLGSRRAQQIPGRGVMRCNSSCSPAPAAGLGATACSWPRQRCSEWGLSAHRQRAVCTKFEGFGRAALLSLLPFVLSLA